MWLHRAAPGAAGHHQPGVPSERAVPVTVGGFARYHRSPVGPYEEVFASPAPVVHAGRISLPIAFMAVDSAASLRGGRANWALPKEMATFSGWSATGEDGAWSVRARVVSTGMRIPLLGAAHLLQVAEDGSLVRSPAWARGVGRAARVDVSVRGPRLAEWLLPGRHLGLAVERATLTVQAPAVVSRV